MAYIFPIWRDVIKKLRQAYLKYPAVLINVVSAVVFLGISVFASFIDTLALEMPVMPFIWNWFSSLPSSIVKHHKPTALTLRTHNMRIITNLLFLLCHFSLSLTQTFPNPGGAT